MNIIEWPVNENDNDDFAQNQFDMLRIGMLLGQDNRDFNVRTFKSLTMSDSVADYINIKYDMNVKRGDDIYRILRELDEKIKARAMPSLPTE
ncbi:hypothetical protein LCGC14_1648330 [marine sediment metagenome]|uniref:Uncharacterized protein n=1 Tax=marine sediment metagenome TaxID=412755 RepID=A0A0F9HXI4_9ZZZZ